MIEWEKRINGSRRFTAELSGPWEGLVLDAVETQYDIPDRSCLMLTLVDSSTKSEEGKILLDLERTVTISGKTVVSLEVKKEKEDVLTYNLTKNELRQWDLNESVKHWTELRLMVAYLLFQDGVDLVRLGGYTIDRDVKWIRSFEPNVGYGNLDKFYGQSWADLLGGLKVKVNLAPDWTKKGYGTLGIRVASPDGNEGWLEGYVKQLHGEPLFLNIRKLGLYGENPLSEDFWEIKEPESINDEAKLIMHNMELVLTYLAARYLKQNYGDEEDVYVFMGVDNLPQQKVLDWNMVEGLTDLWLGLK